MNSILIFDGRQVFDVDFINTFHFASSHTIRDVRSGLAAAPSSFFIPYDGASSGCWLWGTRRTFLGTVAVTIPLLRRSSYGNTIPFILYRSICITSSCTDLLLTLCELLCGHKGHSTSVELQNGHEAIMVLMLSGRGVCFHVVLLWVQLMCKLRWIQRLKHRVVSVRITTGIVLPLRGSW